MMISDPLLIGKPISLLLIKQRLFYLMPLDVFLMNMCVVVIALLIRREIKLKKAR
jgi:hypothetical protein